MPRFGRRVTFVTSVPPNPAYSRAEIADSWNSVAFGIVQRVKWLRFERQHRSVVIKAGLNDIEEGLCAL